jgi:hypothetical protein
VATGTPTPAPSTMAPTAAPTSSAPTARPTAAPTYLCRSRYGEEMKYVCQLLLTNK